MTREELQAKLQELAAKKEEAIRRHNARLLVIQESQQEALSEIEARKTTFIATIVSQRREVDKKMRSDTMLERTQHKLECMAIENERQQLFVDYKAEKAQEEPAEETEADND